jgi:hypothetical protein
MTYQVVPGMSRLRSVKKEKSQTNHLALFDRDSIMNVLESILSRGFFGIGTKEKDEESNESKSCRVALLL